jgi:hypothetical protein
MSQLEHSGISVKETPVTPLLNDSQVADAVSNKMLEEAHTALATLSPKPEQIAADRYVRNEMLTLSSDPQGKAVFNAMAQKIEHHNAALGGIQGHVERGPRGHITGFSFTNTAQESSHNKSLNAEILQGHTMQEAQRDFAGHVSSTPERDWRSGSLKVPTHYAPNEGVEVAPPPAQSATSAFNGKYERSSNTEIHSNLPRVASSDGYPNLPNFAPAQGQPKSHVIDGKVHP